jgi:hypothetical protein
MKVYMINLKKEHDVSVVYLINPSGFNLTL